MAAASKHAPMEEHVVAIVDPEDLEANDVLCPLPVGAELEAAKAKTERLRGEMTATEAKPHAMSNEYMTEAEEAAAASGDDEYMLLKCVLVSKEEVKQARQENTKLLESQRMLCEENDGLRNLLKKMAVAMRHGNNTGGGNSRGCYAVAISDTC